LATEAIGFQFSVIRNQSLDFELKTEDLKTDDCYD